MLNIAICDDEKIFRNAIRAELLKFTNKTDTECYIDEYSNGDDLISSMKHYDLIFMDFIFENSNENGVEISSRIREFSKTVPIIFCSSYPEAVFKTFEVNAFRFLRKPVNSDEFMNAMSAFIKTTKTKDYVILKSENEQYPVCTSDIICLEAYGKKTLFYISGRKEPLECVGMISGHEEKLPKESFFRCQKSFIVNLDWVKSYTNSTITLKNDVVVSIGRGKYSEFVTFYMGHIFGPK